MPSPDPLPDPAENDAQTWQPHPDSRGANTDWIRLIAAAADLCRKPLRHAVVGAAAGLDSWDPACEEACLRLEARDAQGQRLPEEDLELEIYRSGSSLNLTLAWCADERRPMLWQGSHPLWMDPAGSRCAVPTGGQPLEALARRLRALLGDG